MSNCWVYVQKTCNSEYLPSLLIDLVELMYTILHLVGPTGTIGDASLCTNRMRCETGAGTGVTRCHPVSPGVTRCHPVSPGTIRRPIALHAAHWDRSNASRARRYPADPG